MIAIEASGAGEPLVLLHGVNTTHRIWQRVVPRFASAERLVLTPDLPGFGNSSLVGNGFDLERVADALAESLVEHGATSFDLLGHSLGGAVALTLAHRWPGLVRRLVLVAPAGFKPKGSLVAGIEGHGYAALVDIRDVVSKPLIGNAAFRSLVFRQVIADPAHLAPADARLMLETSRGGTNVRKAIIAVEGVDLRPTLVDLRLPLGLVWGRRDRLVSFATLAELRELKPKAEVETISQCGHVPQIEKPSAFASAVEKLMQRLPVAGAATEGTI